MEKLVKGIHNFQRGYFASNRALFEYLAKTDQKPETLFVTCSDSRVVPNLITGAAPGDLFIVRNVGNVIPRPTLPGGTAAAIEYAVEVLRVQNIIVCGHTNCGAVNAILNPERMDALPHVRRWLSETTRVREVIDARYSHLSGEARMLAAVEENVLVQLENLREYPLVARRLEAGEVMVSGWVFDIGKGEVYGFDPAQHEFVSLRPDFESARDVKGTGA
jgi:carbonic anhydrase